jgi:hypothetical protein
MKRPVFRAIRCIEILAEKLECMIQLERYGPGQILERMLQ